MGNENKKEQKEDHTRPPTMPKSTDKPSKQQSLRSNVIVSGLNSQNQLGYAFSTEDNTAQDTTYKPVLLDLDKFDGSLIKAVACYGYHSVFLTEQNRLFSAGANGDSELGVGHNNVVVSPVQPILQNEKIVQLACGFYHTLFLTEDGRIFACGRGSDGQLGFGDIANVAVPTLVPLSDRITMIRCGYYHSLAKSGTIKIQILTFELLE
jgi:alpha-tubulin suppressor-like RCC1 family protein